MSKYDNDSDTSKQLYCSIGRFAVKFEHLCLALREGIDLMLTGRGLSDPFQQIRDILVGDLTIDPLQSIYRSLYSETANPNDEKQTTIKQLWKDIDDLKKNRNEVLHAAWFIGWANEYEDEPKEVTGWKPGSCKKGAKNPVIKASAVNFDSLSEKAELLTNKVRNIHLELLLKNRI